jgi:alpha-D-ribose 1-methylphosphonate 5-triphosphate synthase subunit PhnL
MGEGLITVQDLKKSFVLHLQGGVRLSVLNHVNLSVQPGECVVLNGPSGSGKSTLLRLLYSNYRPEGGAILIRHREEWVNVATVETRVILDVRIRTMGYVSQFFRVIPRVSALDIVTEPLLRLGLPAKEARGRAEDMLSRVNIHARLWGISPTTFSGGEHQRVNIARCFVVSYPILLLDEPTAALDAANRQTVVELIQEARDRGTGIVGVFHDEGVRDAVATRRVDMRPEEGIG